MLTIYEAAGDSVTIATMLRDRAERLRRFVEMKAPPVIVEAERLLVLEAILAMPVNAEAQAFQQRVKAEAAKHEHEHLQKTGFYDDAAVWLQGGTGGDAPT